MTSRHLSARTLLTRRQAIQRGVALGAGIAAGPAALRGATAQGPLQATPAPGAGYARPESLVDVAWLADRIDDAGLVVVAFMPLADAERARIPGSVQIDWPELEAIDTSDASLARWHPAVEERIGDLGIARRSTVVVYDNGTLFGARLWWLLRYLGHERMHILNGGLAAWQEAGRETDSGPILRTMIEHPPYEGTPDGELIAQIDEVLASLDDPGTAIVDARTPEEYAEGHIPGAVNVNYPRNAAPDPPMLYRLADELLAMYADVGVTPDRRVIPYCTSGVRSAVTAFTLHLIGFDRVALFTGSWQEWEASPDAPITEGDQS